MERLGRGTYTGRRKTVRAWMNWDCLPRSDRCSRGDFAAMQSARVDGRCPGEIAAGRSSKRNGAAAGAVCLRWYGQQCGANWGMGEHLRPLRIATEFHLVC